MTNKHNNKIKGTTFSTIEEYYSSISFRKENVPVKEKIEHTYTEKEIIKPNFESKIETKFSYNNIYKSVKESGATHSTKSVLKSLVRDKPSNQITHERKMPTAIIDAQKFAYTRGVIERENKLKRVFAKTTDNTARIEAQNLGEFVTHLLKVDKKDVENLLFANSVTVNGRLVSDSNMELKTNDVVRVGIAHYLNGHKGIGIKS